MMSSDGGLWSYLIERQRERGKRKRSVSGELQSECKSWRVSEMK